MDEPKSPTGLSSDLLEKVRKSATRISTRITTVRLEKAGSTTIAIKPRDVGTDFEGWEVDGLFGTQTLETAIIVGMEMQARG